MNSKKILVTLLLSFAIYGCTNDEGASIPQIDALSLYWDHEVFSEAGRGLRFEVTSSNEFDNDYELQFNTSIDGKSINAVLTRSIDQGKCPIFPVPVVGDDDPNKCNATGLFSLSDSDLGNGDFSLKIIMPTFTVTSKLTITDEKVTLHIPSNNYLSSSIEMVYPIPPGLLFGSIIYQGLDNASAADKYLQHLTQLGLIQTTVPNYPYRHLQVDENGLPLSSQWQPDYYMIGLLYKMNSTDFRTIFEESKKFFDQTNLNIYLYTSNGDQGFMSKQDGITVVYAK